MCLDIFVKGIILGLIVSVPLGPVGALCIRKTLNKGFRTALLCSFGAASGDLIFAAIAGLGVGAIVDVLSSMQIWIKTIGSIILILIGIRIFNANPAIQARQKRKAKNTHWEDFLSPFFLTFANPGPLFVFMTGFAGFVVTEDVQYMSIFFAMLGIFVGGFGWWILLTSGVNLFRKKIRLRHLLYINKIVGVVICLCAIYLLIEPVQTAINYCFCK